MKNIYSNIYKNSKKNLNKAKNLLMKNHIVALPTETVYGLAGNAYKKGVVKKIFNLKKRPKKNPLIIHYDSLNELKEDAYINSSFLKLYYKFSPGPLTYILKKKKNSKICTYANANLDTIAVRFPKHKDIKKLMKKINFPLAIPSANISSKISPVSAIDVVEEFGNKIKFVLDGGRSKIGLESTVVKVSNEIKIIRPGLISKKEIERFLKKKVTFSKQIKKIISPGLLKKHYSPGIPMKLNCKNREDKAAFIVFGKKYNKNKNVFNLSKKGSLREAGKNLYKTFRKIKRLKYKKINVARIPNKDFGIAINDRLKKASN